MKKIFFEIFIKWYSRFYLLTITITWITFYYNIDIYKVIIKVMLLKNLFTVVISYFIHNQLYRYLLKNKDMFALFGYAANIKREKDIISLILSLGQIIPEDIPTVTKDAHLFLKSAQKNSFIYYILKNGLDKKRIRFEWLKIVKNDYNKFLDKLYAGDNILYHNNKSILGKIIRFVTRCYWEHAAIYNSDGIVSETAIGGFRKSSIKEWYEDKDVELAVLRHPSVKSKNQTLKYVQELNKEHEGTGYGYFSLLRMFWIIIIGKMDRVSMMSFTQLLVNIILIIIAYILFLNFTNSVVILLVFLMFNELYLIDTSYNPFAFKKEYSNFKKA